MRFKIAIAIACVTLMGVNLPANAQKKYTLTQLRTMVDSRKYPDQAEPSSNKAESLDFAPCKALVEGLLAQVSDNYPVRMIVETDLVFSKKIWINDAAVVYTCSKLDRNFVTVMSRYR